MSSTITGAPGQSLSFRTKGSWAATELRRFLAAVEQMYGVFLVGFWLAELRQSLETESVNQQVFRESLFGKFLSEGWSHATWPHRAPGKPLYDFWIFPEEKAREENQFAHLLETSVFRGYENPYRLMIRSVRMASPGSISFEGLGGVIEQVRELVKDISYRNNQEKRLGELRIVAIQRALERAPGATIIHNPALIDRSTRLLDSAAEVVQDLEQKGLLDAGMESRDDT